MAADPKNCLRCNAALPALQHERVRRCPNCGSPYARHDLSPEKFPLKIKFISGTTGEVVWSRVVTINEARELAKVEVPSFVASRHYPVHAEIEYADGTTEDGGK